MVKTTISIVMEFNHQTSRQAILKVQYFITWSKFNLKEKRFADIFAYMY